MRRDFKFIKYILIHWIFNTIALKKYFRLITNNHENRATAHARDKKSFGGLFKTKSSNILTVINLISISFRFLLLPGHRCEFTISLKGNMRLLIDGYEFSKKWSRQDRIYWNCIFARSVKWVDESWSMNLFPILPNSKVPVSSYAAWKKYWSLKLEP